MYRVTGIAVVITIVVLLPTPARAQDFSFSLGGGYSNLHASEREVINSHNVVDAKSFYAREGPYVSAEIHRHFAGGPVPLDVGFAVSWTGHFDSYDVPIYNPNPPTGGIPQQYGRLNSQVNLSSFEGCIGLPLCSRGSSGLFVTPRIGLGLLYAHSVVDTSESTIGGTFFYDSRHTGFAGVVRPGVQLGYATQRFAAGVEVSYMYAYGDLTPFGNSMTEFRAGLFLRYRF